MYRNYQKDHADQLVTIFPGVKEMLQDLKEKGYVLGIVTSRTRESALRYMDMLGITSLFDDMVTCDDTTVHKPNPEPLRMRRSSLA